MDRGEIFKLALQQTSNVAEALKLAKEVTNFLGEHEPIELPTEAELALRKRRIKDTARARTWREKVKAIANEDPVNKYKPWTKENLTELKSLMDQGLKPADISRKLGRTYDSVYVLVKQIRRGGKAESRRAISGIIG
jgi:hypothetical protein